jgi:hypothetical protein
MINLNKVNFQYRSLVPPVQNYTGIESEKVSGIDLIHYQIHGTGKMIRPHMGPEFGWSAMKNCVVTGCIG